MTTLTEARTLMLDNFLTKWKVEHPTVPVTWQNISFDPPDRSSWVRVVMLHTSGGEASIGSPGDRVFRRNGLFIAQVFTPSNEGAADGYEFAQTILNIVDGVTIGGIWFRNGTVNEIGASDAFYQINVTVEFTYDEVK